jgi:hypothetical protein
MLKVFWGIAWAYALDQKMVLWLHGRYYLSHGTYRLWWDWVWEVEGGIISFLVTLIALAHRYDASPIERSLISAK